jgi:hypothetical protein
MERQQVRGPAFHTQTVSHACLPIFALLCRLKAVPPVPLRKALPFGRSICIPIYFIAAEKLLQGAQHVKLSAITLQTSQLSEVTLLSL